LFSKKDSKYNPGIAYNSFVTSFLTGGIYSFKTVVNILASIKDNDFVVAGIYKVSKATPLAKST
jgi:hypothetical protein